MRKPGGNRGGQGEVTCPDAPSTGSSEPCSLSWLRCVPPQSQHLFTPSWHLPASEQEALDSADIASKNVRARRDL